MMGEASGCFQTSSTLTPVFCDDCYNLNDSWENSSDVYRQLPPHLRFNSDSLIVVIVYSILFVVAAVGNLSVFISLIRSRHRKSRMSMMMTHLTIADLIVTFLMIPLEIGWRITTQWIAGNFACKFFLFFRAFGLYLSSNVLVCVSLDRYFAVLHPLKVSDARRRGKIMLAVAWATSFMCSVPQSVVFHVSQHPEYPEFHQCVSFNYFTSRIKETVYNVFCVVAMYFIPLIIITCAYSCILYEILNKTKENRDANQRPEEGESTRRRGRMRLRRNDMTNIERARTRTIKMSVTIVAAFVWCWTPYVVMTMWYIFDRASAETLDSRLQDGLFIMAVSNSCMNPLVYGSYAIDCRRPWCHCSCFLFSSGHARQRTEITGSQNHILKLGETLPIKPCLNINNNSPNMFAVTHTATRSTHLIAENRRYHHHKLPRPKGMVVARPTVSEFNLTRIQLELPNNLPEYHSDPGRNGPSPTYILLS